MSKKLDDATANKLEAFNKEVAASAESIIFDVFPSRILTLQKLIDDSASPASPFHPSHGAKFTDTTVYPAPAGGADGGEPPRKRRRAGADGSPAPTGSEVAHARFPNEFRANAHLVKVQEEIKRLCEELAMNCDKIKLWINLNMPRIEDGDNFGVQVQEECLNELHRSQESCVNLRDAARQHYLTRAKIASKLLKYPHIEDYALGLKEHDMKQLYMARQNLHDVRNIHAVLFDILNKNITKLRSPKGNNSSSMY